MIWIPITLAAAFIQNGRFMLQRRLTDLGLSSVGATFARYLFAAPFVYLLLGLILCLAREPLPHMSVRFLAAVALAAILQILGTVLTIALFKRRNFAVGAIFKHTDVMMAAVFGLLILSDPISHFGWLAIALGFVGTLLLSKSSVANDETLVNKGLMLGLGSGLAFGLCGVYYRMASLSLASENVLVSAITTLAASITVQTILLSLYFQFREREQIALLWAHRGLGLSVGLASLLGSSLLFIAMTLVAVAYVTAVMQAELIFVMLASYLYYKERLSWREILGCIVIAASVLVLIFWS